MTKIINTEYEKFVIEQLNRFKKYYKEGTTNSRRELKKALYGKKDLSQMQKDKLWERIKEK